MTPNLNNQQTWEIASKYTVKLCNNDINDSMKNQKNVKVLAYLQQLNKTKYH